MLKIKPYDGVSFSFYQEVIDSKRNTANKPRLIQELASISDNQSDCFDSYDEAFTSNTLADIEAESYNNRDKTNLKELYNYRSKKIRMLKDLLTRHPLYPENILNTCQNCTINEVDSMDHVLGQTEFPEFSVHPKNLFPCCSVCNKRKSDKYIDEDGSQLFLNLFLDDLPQSQYLHVDFGDNWLPRFYLEQPDDVSDDMYGLIERHYQQLDLLDRFRKSSNEIISTLRFTIKASGGNGVREKIDEMCQDFKPVFGYNHRQVVLYRTLGLSEEFILDCIG